MTEIFIKQLPHGADLPLPSYATAGAAGVDLYAAIDAPITLDPMARTAIPTGISIALPQGTEAQIRARSGLALKQGLAVLNAPGTIDSDYRGEIAIILINLGADPILISHGMRIAQMVIARHETLRWQLVTDDLPASKRAGGGFGSTGIKTQTAQHDKGGR
ncbi:MAG: dUTP diphosphatase [Alphaproteobacteria bacterium]